MTRRRFIILAAVLYLLQIVLNISMSWSVWFFLSPLCFVIVGMDRGVSAVRCMVSAFVIGLSVDFLSSGITGLWSASMVASVIPRLLMVKRRAWDDGRVIHDAPHWRDMGFVSYLVYVSIVNLAFHACYVLLEKAGTPCSCNDLFRILASTAVNTVLMLMISLMVRDDGQAR